MRSHVMRPILAAAMAAALLAGCASHPTVPAAARAELAPTGTLRAGMNLSNTLFTGRDAATGELRGVSVDLMRALGERLGVPVAFVVYPTPGEVADDAGAGRWDVAVLAIEPARARTITFSPPMTEIEATYVVRRDATRRSAPEMDAAGVRIAAAAKAGYELYLARTLRNATLVRTGGFGASIDAFNAGSVDAVAGLKPALLEALPRMPDGRLAEGRFMTVNHGLATPRERPDGAAFLAAFVEEMKASGFIARSIERHGVQGLSALR